MIELSVNDMTCGSCVAAVTRAVKMVDAQARVQVDLGSKRVVVDGARPAGELMRALGEAGFPATAVTGDAPPAARRGCCCS